MRLYKNIDTLLKAIERKETQLNNEQTKTTNQFSKLGFGHSMRCTKINISFSKEDKLKDDLKSLYIQLNDLNNS